MPWSARDVSVPARALARALEDGLVVLLDRGLVLRREGGVVLSCDALHHMPEPDEYFDEASAEKLKSFFHPANIGPGWLRAAKPERSDFDRLLELPFKHLLTGHGIPLLNEAPAAVRATVERVFG